MLSKMFIAEIVSSSRHNPYGFTATPFRKLGLKHFKGINSKKKKKAKLRVMWEWNWTLMFSAKLIEILFSSFQLCGLISFVTSWVAIILGNGKKIRKLYSCYYPKIKLIKIDQSNVEEPETRSRRAMKPSSLISKRLYGWKFNEGGPRRL